eukprot:9023990-Ditylum_brightwellii.AAC.1
MFQTWERGEPVIQGGRRVAHSRGVSARLVTWAGKLFTKAKHSLHVPIKDYLSSSHDFRRNGLIWSSKATGSQKAELLLSLIRAPPMTSNFSRWVQSKQVMRKQNFVCTAPMKPLQM